MAPTARASYLVQSVDAKGKRYVCHSYLTAGVLEFLSDSTHEYAGKTYRLQPADIYSGG